MKAKFEGDSLIIEVPLTLNKTSRSGNSNIVATSRGQQFIGNFKGRPTYLQLNVMQMGDAGTEVEVEGAPEPVRTRKAA